MERHAGSDAKGDCRVTARASDRRTVRVTTKSPELLEPGIRSVCCEVLDALGAERVEIDVEDAGSLDYVLRARVEAAVREVTGTGTDRHGGGDGGVSRRRSSRDRPRRSRLYVPGNHPRLLVGLETHGADCVLIDLEDSVPHGEKRAARILVKHLLSAVAFPEEVWVRINPLDAGGADDLDEVLQGHPHGVCLPKSESADAVQELVRALEARERALGRQPGSTWIMPIVETARGVLRCDEVAAADERVVMLAFGAEDYMRDVGARRTQESLLFARSRIVAAARAAGIQASDTVYGEGADEAGLAVEAAHARDLGFDGKGAIHPRQIAAIHRAFSPTKEELAWAEAIVEAARRAEEEGIGAVSVDGRMVDAPVVERARRWIRYAARLSRGEGD